MTLKLKFSRFQRLLTRREYREIYNCGHKYLGNKILIFYRLARSSNPRLGITITKKWGKAHDRNRFKRVVREGYRTEYLKLPPNMELNVHPREEYRELLPEEVERELRILINICDKENSKSQSAASGRND